MAGEDDGLLRWPLPPGFNEAPTARITIGGRPTIAPLGAEATPAQGPEALGAAGAMDLASTGVPTPQPQPLPAPQPERQSPLSILDPTMFPPAPPKPAPQLQPVEHDPFTPAPQAAPKSQLLIPVDFDPFDNSAFEAASRRISAQLHGGKRFEGPDKVDAGGPSKMMKAADITLGLNGEERFQFFPERWARAAASEFGRAASGQFPDTVYVPIGGSVDEKMLNDRYHEMTAGAEGASNFAMMGGPLQMAGRGFKGPGGNVLSTGGAQPPAAKPGAPAAPFYSAVEKTVQDSTLKSATPEQWLGTLKNAKGVKGEELDWLGLPEWLAEQKGPVTKQQVADYVAGHKVELKEVRKFDDDTDAFHDAVMNRADEYHEKWVENSARLARGEGIEVVPVDDSRGRRGHGQSGFWATKVDGDIIGRFKDKASAAEYGEQFKAEAAREATKKGDGDFMDFSHEVAMQNSADLHARHGVEGRVLPGGENYREILLTLPNKDTRLPYKVVPQPDGSARVVDATGREQGRYFGPPAAEAEAYRLNNAPDNSGFRVSGHWDEPNVLAWSRVNDRTIDGKKALFVEEVQSDWHQRGREHGYKPAEADKLVDRAYDAWKQEHGITDEAHVTAADKRAWVAAIEAKNPEVYNLYRKAETTRNLRARSVESAYADAAREFMPGAENHGDGGQLLAQLQDRPFDKILPTSMREVSDLVSARVLTSGQAQKIMNAAQDHLDLPEVHAIADRAEAAQRALEAGQRKNIGGVPDAPLKKTWHELVLKRMIREAAEHGYDTLAWTTGAQQNKRWSLSSHVTDVSYEPSMKRLLATTKNGRGIEETIPPDKLADYLGKEVAEKLLAAPLRHEGDYAPVHKLEGLDLEVGGSGMKGFYDKMMVDSANKIAKAFGGKVTKGTIPNEQLKKMWPGGEEVHTLDITPTMRDAAVGKGFPLFMGGVPVSRVQHDPFAEDDQRKKASSQ